MGVDGEVVRRQPVRSADRSCPPARAWVDEAIRRVAADAYRSADIRLLCHPLPADREIHRWPARCCCTGCVPAGSPGATPYGETLDHSHRTGHWGQP